MTDNTQNKFVIFDFQVKFALHHTISLISLYLAPPPFFWEIFGVKSSSDTSIVRLVLELKAKAADRLHQNTSRKAARKWVSCRVFFQTRSLDEKIILMTVPNPLR